MTSPTPSPMPIAISDLVVRFGDVTAVDSIDLVLEPGSLHGIVGPNGAGKSTTLDCVMGLLTPTAGTVSVAGRDPARHRRAVHRHLGVMLQDNSLYRRIRVAEAVRLFASFSADAWPVGELLARLDLESRAHDRYETLSHGQRRRVLLALAIVGHPAILVLDEPTSGLDPIAAGLCWTVLQTERRRGASILLSTHDMIEAQQECDAVSLIDHGRIVASGHPTELMGGCGLETHVSAAAPAVPTDLIRRVSALEHVRFADVVGTRIVLVGTGRGFVQPAERLFAEAGVPPTAVEIRPANFEDFFLMRTGRGYEAPELTEAR